MLAIDSRRRAKDEMMHPCAAHFVEQHQGPINIILIILQRQPGRLAYRFKTGKMDNGADVMLVENLLQHLRVLNIALIENQVFIG